MRTEKKTNLSEAPRNISCSINEAFVFANAAKTEYSGISSWSQHLFTIFDRFNNKKLVAKSVKFGPMKTSLRNNPNCNKSLLVINRNSLLSVGTIGNSLNLKCIGIKMASIKLVIHFIHLLIACIYTSME
jgi:hypothetical protein